MQQIVICLFLLAVATSHSFFLTSKDVKKILQYFPKAFEVETNPRHHRPGHYRHRDDYRYRDEYIHDNHDRSYDNAEHRRSVVKSPRGKIGRIHNDKALYHPHSNCDHPDHYHHNHKHSEERVEKNYERDNEQNDKRNHHEMKKETPQHDKDYERNIYEKITHDKQGNGNYRNKDYVTGVLITIPKIKNEEDDYYRDNRQQNVFLQQLLKAEEDEDDRESSSSYLY